MKIKEKLKKIAYCIFTTLCSLAVIYLLIQTIPYVANIYKDKDAPGKNIPLRDDRQQFDVLLVGASHMGAILPGQLWNRHGISCYNSYSDGNGMRKTVSSLELSLQYCKPELVIIECETWWLDPDFFDDSGRGNYHHAFDSYPLFTPFSDALSGAESLADIDWNKANIINQFKLQKLAVVKDFVKDQELLAKKVNDNNEDSDSVGIKSEADIENEMAEIGKEMAVPFYTYHSRWQELTEEDFEPEIDYLLGGRIRPQSNAFEMPERIMNADYIEDDDVVADIQYVEKAIKLCQDNDVQVLLVCLPYIQGEKVQGRHNKLYEICDQYGVQFINMMYERDLVNYSYDFRDAGHMNLSGGTKCADFLANYIKEKYGIQDRRGDSDYEGIWAENYSLFKQGLKRELPDISSWDQAANFLGLDEFEGELYLLNPASEYEEYADYEYLDEEESDEEAEDEASEDLEEGEKNQEFEMCNNPGKLGLIRSIKKNGYKIYGIESAVAKEEPYLIKITRTNGQTDVQEYIGDQIKEAGIEIPDDCTAWTCIRDSESKEVCLEKTLD